jgi:hypothetical protein
MRLGGLRDFIGCLLALLVLACVMTFPLARSALAGPSVDDINDPMKFVIVRSSTPFCEPSCPEFIWARGAIETATSSAFSKFLKKIGNRKLPIVVSSPGGSVESAFKMGRMIRERKLEVGVGSVYLTACPASWPDCEAQQKKTGVYSGVIVDYGTYCNSACPLLLASGTRRFAGPTTYVGVHQITTTYTREKIRYRERYKIVKGKKRVIETKVVSRKKVGTYQTAKLSKSSSRAFLAYLKEMGIAKSYFDAAQGTPAKDMRQLFRGELLAMSLTTGDEPAVIFARAGRCDQPAPAANCVLREGYGGDRPLAKLQPGSYPKPDVPEDSGMWFVVVRSSEAGCEPHCPEWISAEGDIDANALPRLAATLKALGGRKLPLVLSSTGGDVETSMAMGKMIRKERLDVAVGSTVFAGCKPRDKGCIAPAKSPGPLFGNAVSSGSGCTRDCMLVLAAGKTRVAGYGTLVGWHYTDTPSSSVVAPYLQEMGVSLAFDNITPIQLDYPDQARLMTAGLLTRTVAVDLLVDGAICGLIPIPANCRLASPGEFARKQ